MKNIRPITDLRKSNEISEQAHSTQEPIYITKNGYGDLVVLAHELFEEMMGNGQGIASSLSQSNSYQDALDQSAPMGFIKVACATIDVLVSDVNHNAQDIIQKVRDCEEQGCSLLVLPELCLSGYTCQDLFLQDTLLTACEREVDNILKRTADCNIVFVFGVPIRVHSKLYNSAIVAFKGKILGIVPKVNLPNYHEFYELRHFEKAPRHVEMISYAHQYAPFGSKILFRNRHYVPMTFAIEICEDLWVPNPPSTEHALAGANIICNLSASNEIVGKKDYREMLVKATSARLICAYLYSSAGNGESTTDLVFSGENIIAENGTILEKAELFTNETIMTEIDLEKIINERQAMTSYPQGDKTDYCLVDFSLPLEAPAISRFSKTPFIPAHDIDTRTKEIFELQVMGLLKRITHTNVHALVLGLSGGLDSTLALLVAVETMKRMQRPLKEVHCLTMPCFGTSDRTKNNAYILAESFGGTLLEINIEKAVRQHFKDIGHDESVHDVTYENSQARERTQILMDYANKVSGLVIGTGDLSELALGWATYNGDHMSNYGVNASIPKTLVRHLVRQYAMSHLEVKDVLLDVIDTPVSPELLPTTNDKISQKTEDIIGPYELHDFFLFHLLRNHYSVKKIYYIACQTFNDGTYDKATIKKWFRVFLKRFFAQQFKRSCLPDGVKVGSVSLSPRGDLRMPSDASSASFLKELDEIE